jgi:hypothetical protein
MSVRRKFIRGRVVKVIRFCSRNGIAAPSTSSLVPSSFDDCSDEPECFSYYRPYHDYYRPWTRRYKPIIAPSRPPLSPLTLFQQESIQYVKNLNLGFNNLQTSNIPSLLSKCLVNIAENLSLYDWESLFSILSGLSCEDVESFLYECFFYGSLNSQNFDLFAAVPLRRAILPPNISDSELITYLDSLASNQNLTFKHADSWENLDPNSFAIFDRRKALTDIYLTNSSFCLETLENLGKVASSLESLRLINTNFLFSNHMSAEEFDEENNFNICYKTLVSIFLCFPRLSQLDLVNCCWLQFKGFSQFLQYYEDHPEFEEYRCMRPLHIRLSGFQRYVYHDHKGSGWPEVVEQSKHLSPRIQISVDFF